MIVVIISQCIQVSDHRTVHLKYICFICQLYFSKAGGAGGRWRKKKRKPEHLALNLETVSDCPVVLTRSLYHPAPQLTETGRYC